jgi:cephalosporin hydroxylase
MAKKDSNPLLEYFKNNTGRLIHKWIHYFDIYDRHFSTYRGRSITVLEIGVSHGGSLQMWKKYFGRRARIIGMDVDERTRKLAEPRVEIVIGDQSSREFMRELAVTHGPFDIVIDDGGHTMEQQIVSFEELWPHVRNGGTYLVEDLHTSYWPEFGGGHLNPDSFIEYAKRIIDAQHAWHAREGDGLEVNDMTRTVRGMHAYDSIIVFDKAEVTAPYHEQIGTPTL